ncbi:MAG: beta-lactamase class [Gaiellales bacterium]|nr:beta-lactamase class [Gaiellales bacterium]
MISVCAIDLPSGRTIERDADVVLPAASTIKLLVSLALWRAVRAGRVDPSARVPAGAAPRTAGGGVLESLDDATAVTLADLDLLMLAVSDNAAANALIGLLGMDAVNAEADRLGLAATRLRRLMSDDAAIAEGRENTTTATDMARLMAELGRAGERRTVAALARSQHVDIIPRLLPPANRVVACKQGWRTGRVLHDVALIEEDGRQMVLAVLSSPPASREGLARVAAGVHAEMVAMNGTR